MSKKRALNLGIRISLIFLTAVLIIIFIVYSVLLQNFQILLTDYTIQLVESMANQGVEIIEIELATSKKEAASLADDFIIPETETQHISFPLSNTEHLRLIYVSESETFASDGRLRDVRDRHDIQAAFQGEIAVYGPYFNEENEFVVCYSAPVTQNGSIVGVLSIEKDGYRFCDLIESIQFGNTGESYIINAEGTDIAVSDPDHIDWVNSEYNAQKLLDENATEETRLILELEQKGLRGETGLGTYYWENGLVYVFYKPIPSVNWVLLAGLREEEIVAMTQSTFAASISNAPALLLCIVIFFLLSALIIFWIISSMKKNAEINKKLELIANHDSLTGLLNRRFLEDNLLERWKGPVKAPCSSAIYMLDIDDFKKYNDFFGHPKGDDCLRHVASVFKHAFDGCDCYVLRYGGEEFMAAVFQTDKQLSLELGSKICRLIENENLPDGRGGIVTVSIGVCYVDSTQDAALYDCIKIADKALYEAKKGGKNRARVIYT